MDEGEQIVLDPGTGFDAALVVGISAGVLTVVVMYVFGAMEIIWSDDGTHHDLLGALLGALLLALPVAAALFSASYGLLNPALQPEHWTVAALQADLAGGTLTLRIVSLVLAWKAIRAVLGFLGEGAAESLSMATGNEWRPPLPVPKRPSVRPVKGGESIDQLTEIPSGYPNVSGSDIVPLWQLGFYLSVLTLLWVINGLELPQSALYLLLSFALLFIVDDWILIQDYSAALNGHALRSHRVRVNLANLVIAPTAVWVSYDSLPTREASISSLAILACVGARYLYSIADD